MLWDCSREIFRSNVANEVSILAIMLANYKFETFSCVCWNVFWRFESFACL